MIQIVIIQVAVVGISLAYLPVKAANSLFIDVCNQAPHRLPKIDVQ